jgi:hypothetical protein
MVSNMWRSISALLLLLSILIHNVYADQLIEGVNSQGEEVLLSDNREPALYTQDFGSCVSNAQDLISLSRFDAALYIDNLTVTFHIGGLTSLASEPVMVYLSVFAYGENRFELAWNPCGTSMVSLCPAKSSVPIVVSGIIPLGTSDIVDIPNIAFSIPDFEGQAILRIFGNTTQSEIACYTASVTNGHTFEQVETVGSVLGVFTFVAVISSVATAIYGEVVSEMRTHHAHSLSVMVVFAVFHHIYFTGALSMNWPRILVSFWSNYAWAAGMIYDSAIQNSLSKLIGNSTGNTLDLGAASTNANSSNVGGGFDITQIYKRQPSFETARLMGRSTRPPMFLDKRNLASASDGFKWYGNPVREGLPLPGNYSGFAGTLSVEGIPAANALLTGLIWLLILVLIISFAFVVFKFSLDLIIRFKKNKPQRLNYFRRHWIRFLGLTLLKTFYIAFFMMMFLTIFQFTYDEAPAAIAIAAVVFVIFLVGLVALCGFACYHRLRLGTWHSEPDRTRIEKTTVLKFLPWFHFHRGHKVINSDKKFIGSLPGWRLSRQPPADQVSVHDDEAYMRKYGWLSARFRTSRWWFFAVWLIYEFVRACFYAGASGHALVQVFCILVIEIIAFIITVKLKPYEGQRLNVVMIYLLGFSKVMTVALSAAFDINFGIQRITATVIGVLIIIIQALLTIALLICIVLSAISSYFSVTRYKEEIKPKSWMPHREKYFAHIQQRATDRPLPPKPKPVKEEPKDPYFSVTTVRRMAKIEDEDEEFQREIYNDPRNPLSDEPMAAVHESEIQVPKTRGTHRRASVARSMRSTMSHSSLPYGAVLHRGSWSTRDFAEYQRERESNIERYPLDSYLSAQSSQDSLRAQGLPFAAAGEESPTIARLEGVSTPATTDVSPSDQPTDYILGAYQAGGGPSTPKSNKSTDTRQSTVEPYPESIITSSPRHSRHRRNTSSMRGNDLKLMEEETEADTIWMK